MRDTIEPTAVAGAMAVAAGLRFECLTDRLTGEIGGQVRVIEAAIGVGEQPPAIRLQVMTRATLIPSCRAFALVGLELGILG